MESRHEECVLQGLIKNKCMETNITEHKQNSPEREGKCQSTSLEERLRIMKQGHQFSFVISDKVSL